MGTIKINRRFERNFSIGESDIYRKFNEQFDNLFNTEEVAKTDSEFENTYVEDKDFEDQLNVFRTSKTSMTKFCVGYTGIGKTTTIRHVFNIGVSNEAKFLPKKKEIVFPTFLDGYSIDDIKKFNISKRISAVCSKMEREHPELKEYMKTFEGKKEFHDFIEKHTDFALENVNSVDAIDMDENELILQRLRGAYEKNEYEYQANRLKFYIMKKYDTYERLIIILDDIETLPVNYQKETICKFLKLYSCLKNTEYIDGYTYNINLLISVRPHTHRFFNENREIEAFPISEPAILKKESVDLEDIFTNRFDYYTKIGTKEIGNMNTWIDCRKALMEMNQQFDGQYKKMIKNLCFMNVREALSSYSRIFANRFWVQKNIPKEEAFTISKPEYLFNNINVIRALACNEEEVFWGDNENIIPNIFLTTEDMDLSIYCLMVLKHYVIKTKGLSYGLNAETLKNTFDNWAEIFNDDDFEKIKNATTFLFENRILRKSILDFEDIETLDTAQSLNDDTHLYISPRGDELNSMFKRDSVLFEMLREASWRSYINRDYAEESSYELMKSSQQDIIFLDLLEYLGYFCEQEEIVLSKIKDKNKYKNSFGSESVVHPLLIGVKKSMDYSGLIFNANLANKYKFIKEQVFKVTNNI